MTEPFYFQQTLDEMNKHGRLRYCVGGMLHEDLCDMLIWCFDNIGIGGHLPHYRDPSTWSDHGWSWAFFFDGYYFDREEDATAFALRFA
jgi:hypothetical protein